MPNIRWELKDEMILPWKDSFNDFGIFVKEYNELGTISVFEGKLKDPDKFLLSFSLVKKLNHSSEVKFLEIAKNLKAIKYRPVMGGNHVIIALGKLTSDLSPEGIKSYLPSWNTPYFCCPLGRILKISCDENGVTTKEDYRIFKR